MNASTKALAPAIKKTKVVHDGTNGTEFQMPQRLPSSMNGLRQMPATKIAAIMETMGLPLHGTKVENVAALSKHLKAQQQQQQQQQKAPASTATHPHEAEAEEEAEAEAEAEAEREETNSLLCTGYRFENRVNATPMHEGNVVTMHNVEESAHLGFVPFGRWDWNRNGDVHCELSIFSE